MSSHEKTSHNGQGSDALAADLAALRADVAKLTETMSTLAQHQAGNASAAMSESMEKARVVLDEAVEALTQTGRDLANDRVEGDPLVLGDEDAVAREHVIGMLGRDRR